MPGSSNTKGSPRRVLLLGGCGYVGSALALHLRDHGFEVSTLDLEWFGRAAGVENDRRDYATLSRENLRAYSAVLLFAGHSSVPMCLGNRAAAFRNNVANFVGLLEKLDTQRFIYASSASVYGNTGPAAASEDDVRFSPQNEYDLGKVEIDSYARLSRLDFYGLRLGTVNGFAPHLRMDVMLNKMVASVRESGRLVVANPGISRPILGVRDLCSAVERILEAPAARPGIYNLASFNATVGEIAERAASALGGVGVQPAPSTRSYDMSMSTRRFESTFGFAFEETVESIVHSLVEGWDDAHKTTREEARAYV